MKDGFYKHVGNGETIDIENDIWVGERIQKKSLDPSLVDQELLQCTRVANLIDANGRWNARIIWRVFKRQDAERILSIQLPMETMRILWVGSK